MRTFCSLLLAAASLAASAALPPWSSAPLGAHLTEVNARWQAQDPGFVLRGQQAAFTDEAERIRSHLLLVQERLTDRTPAGLSDTQRQQRARLLHRLRDYADARRFPINDQVPQRHPVFIDPRGTACAVGWLMIESGHAGLARSISEGFNLGYLHEIAADARYAEPVQRWARQHGFSADELAWIQPGYPPNLPWQPFGGGTDGTVTVMAPLSDGRLLVAGPFTHAGGAAASRVALWNGIAFEPLGNGVAGQVNCAIEFNGSVYLGGSMLNGNADLARWNGSAWEFSTVFDGKLPAITALHAHAGVLHAAGILMGFAGEDHLVKRLSGGQWEQVGSGFNGAVLDLATHEGTLVAGGAFTALEAPTQPLALHVARFNGAEWAQLGDGLDATVRDLLQSEGALYAGGDLIQNIAPRFGLARIAAGTAYWEPLMPNLASYIFPTLADPHIERLAEHDGRIYFAGSFMVSTTMMTIGAHIARWDGIDLVTELAYPDDAVHAVAVRDGSLLIGGAFGNWMPHLAQLDLSTGLAERSAATMTASPNPATDAVRISGVDALSPSAQVNVRDASGRAMRAPVMREAGAATIDARGLAPGAYTVHVDGRFAARFVKE